MTRLDKFLADAGVGTRSEVKNMIRKKSVTVNGVPAKGPEQKIDETGDVIAVCEKSRASVKFKGLIEEYGKKAMPKWIERAAESFEAKIVAMPAREDIDFEVSENLIVELYSR